MKILKIKYKNIHSLKGEGEIDFTQKPLADAGIFAITGATGSGKSTLLDIITLALYSQTPRIGQLSKKTVANYGSIITRNTTDCYAEIEYLVKDEKYRSQWSISFARTGNLRDYQMELANLTQDKIIEAHKKSEIPKLNAEIIGLNYEQFVKSIVLSQGEFSKFLKAKPDERGDLLEKITGTEIYRSIGAAAFERKKQEEEKLYLLKTQTEAISILSDEEIESLNNQKIDNEKEILQIDLELEKDEKLLQLKKRIEELKSKSNKILLQKQKIENQIEENNSDFEKLKKHENLQKYQSEIFELKNLHKRHSETSQELQQSRNRLSELQEKLEKYLSETEKLRNIVDDKQNEKLYFEPIIKKVRELENTKNAKTEINLQNKQQFKKIKSNFQKTENEAQKISNQIEINNKEITKTEKWLNNNKIAKDLENDLPELKNLGKNLKELIKKYNQAKLSKEFSAPSWTENLKKCQSKLELCEQKIELIGEPEDDFEQLQKKRKLLLDDYYLLKQKIELSESFENFENKKVRISERLEVLTSQDAEKLDLKNKSENEIKIISKKIEELEIRQQRESLEAKYADDRLKLKENEACFLCGSINHPYVKSYKSELNITEKELKEAERLQKKLEKILAEAKISLAKIATEKQKLDENLLQISSEIKKCQLDFKENNKWKISIIERQKLENELKNIENEGKKISSEVDKLTTLKNEQEKLADQKIALEKIEDIVNTESEIQINLKKYSSYFSDYQDISQAINFLSKVFEKYKNSAKKLEQLQNNVESDNKLLDDKNLSLENQKQELIDLKAILDTEKENLQNISDEINELLPNSSPEKKEKELAENIKIAEQKLQNQEKKNVRTETDISAVEAQIRELEVELQNFSNSIEVSENKLIPKLKNEGYENLEQALTNILPAQKAEVIKKLQEKLFSDKTSENQLFESVNADFKKISENDNPKINLSDLERDISEKKKKRQSSNQNIGVITNKISENTERQKKFSELKIKLDAQEKEFNRWNSLNNLIGSSDGKKFSRFAQELTLMELIGLSNRHLLKLNKRYLLKKSEESLKDNLIVIDRFIANSERSVQTLSGGETFLLSLALALGLSDLASRNTKIESLFIDEGFGTLDQSTLDKSLETLENLQSTTNRTIGIISHVQAIKERVSTQIQLEKINSGHSKVIIKF